MSRDDLLRRIKTLKALRVNLVGRIRVIDQDIDILERAVEAMDRPLMSDGPDWGEGDAVHHPGQTSPLTGCLSMMEAVHRWADMHGGLVRLTPVAREILRVGLSRAHSTAAVSSTLHGYLRKRGDEWLHVAPGVWRRIAPPVGTGEESFSTNDIEIGGEKENPQ